MSFLERYEFEQIVDQDLAAGCDRWQAERNFQPQLSSKPKFTVFTWRTILIGLTAVGLGLGSLIHQPTLAHNQNKIDDVALYVRQK